MARGGSRPDSGYHRLPLAVDGEQTVRAGREHRAQGGAAVGSGQGGWKLSPAGAVLVESTFPDRLARVWKRGQDDPGLCSLSHWKDRGAINLDGERGEGAGLGEAQFRMCEV